MNRRIALWGFVVAGVLFMFAGLMPLLRGGSTRVPFFILGIVFLVLGAGIVRRSRSATPR